MLAEPAVHGHAAAAPLPRQRRETPLAAPDPAPSPDPALPGLAAVLSPHPPGAAPGDECQVRSVEWVPGRRCRVVHRIRGRAGAPALVSYEVTPGGTTVHRPAEDPELPGLRVALDPEPVRRRLAGIVASPISSCLVTPVAYRPGSRAVLAYDVLAGTARSRLYAKVLADGCAEYAAAAAAIRAAQGPEGPPPVPDVVAVWPDLGAVVQRAAPGRPLSGLLADESVPERERLRYAELLGGLLARIHTTPHGGRSRWTADDELTALEALLPATCHADPAAGRALAALVDSLADTAPADEDPVLSHGAFRTGQVVASDGALCLLDLDTVCVSDAARDAGNAAAYLSWADVRGAVRPGLVPALQEAVVAGYADHRPPARAEVLAWWTAAAMAKIAGRRYRTLATSEWPAVPALLNRAVLQLDSASAGTVQGRHRAVLRSAAQPPVDPLDRDRMTDVLREAPTLRAARVRVTASRVLAQAAGRRRVVRYEVEGLDPGCTVPLVGKVYVDRHRSAIAYDNLRQLSAVFADSGRLAVPAPVCHVPALRMVLYREVHGAALDRMPAGPGATGASLAAGWLAALHGSGTVLARRLDLAHEIVNVGVWAARVGEAAPVARAAAVALADGLAAAAAELPGVREVPIHKDLHAAHVLAVGARRTGGLDGIPTGVAVIDLDEARMGDPALDLAHFTTYLEASPRRGAHAARSAFLDSYGPVPGPSPEARCAFFAAYTWMKIAKQLVDGRGPLAASGSAAGTSALLTALRRGVTCLHA